MRRFYLGALSVLCLLNFSGSAYAQPDNSVSEIFVHQYCKKNQAVVERLLELAETSDCNEAAERLSKKEIFNLRSLPSDNREVFDLSVVALFKQVETIHLEENDISDVSLLKPLKNLPNLKYLYLGKNQFREFQVSEDWFRYLRELDLQSNLLNVARDIDVSKLSAIEILNLSSNELTDLPSLPPDLKELWIERNKLATLPALSEIVPKLQVLEANSNLLGDSVWQSIEGMPNLLVLRLHSNQIKNLPRYAVAGVKKVDLASNLIMDARYLGFQFPQVRDLNLSVNNNILVNLRACTQLESLSLIWAEIHSLPYIPPTVKNLRIWGNPLDTMESYNELLTRDASGMKRLEVSLTTTNPVHRNIVKSLRSKYGAALRVTEMDTLANRDVDPFSARWCIRRNKLPLSQRIVIQEILSRGDGDCAAVFKRFKTFNSMALSVKAVDGVYPDFSPLEAFDWLERLSLSNSELGDLTGLEVIRKLPKLKSLDLSSTHLKVFVNDSGLFSNLEELNLSENLFNGPNGRLNLNEMNKLATLWLYRGNLASVPRDILNLPGLTKLSLHTNKITDVSPLTSLARLGSLDLAFNPITENSLASIWTMPALTHLVLDNCGLSSLPDPTNPSHSLLDLSLAHFEGPVDVRRLAELAPNLRRLNLSGIKDLPSN